VLVFLIPECGDEEKDESGKQRVGSPVPFDNFARVRLGDFLVVIVDKPGLVVGSLA
jgi:hypothetical protein